jgi:hypothetical protein
MESNDEMRGFYLDILEKEINTFLPVFREEGETVIRNKSKVFKHQEVEEILSLLHPIYNDLGITITIYDKRLGVIKDWLHIFKGYIQTQTLIEALKRQIGGNHLEGVISIFPFNYYYSSSDNKEIKKKLFLLYDAIHEIRHAFQRIHKKKEYSAPYLGVGKKGYHSQWIEKDANKFAQRFMNKNKEKINEILEINTDWKCVWGRFYFK